MYIVVVFNSVGIDNHVPVKAEELDSFILKAIWGKNFNHLHIFEAQSNQQSHQQEPK